MRVAAMKKEKEAAKRQKAAEGRDKIRKVKLITAVADIYSSALNLTIPKLHEQLEVLQFHVVPDIKANNHYPHKADKQKALEDAFNR